MLELKLLEIQVIINRLLILLVVSVNIYALEVEGRLDRYNTGVFQGRRFVSCVLRRSDEIYEYNAVSSEADSTYNYLLKKIEDAFYSEKFIKLIYDNDSTRIIQDIVIHKTKMVKYEFTKTFIKSWERPESKEKAYNVGDSVIIGGRFVSLIDSNMWSPREAPNFWKLKKGTKLASRLWKKPEGAHDCYNKGAFLLYKGSKFESVIDGNIWSPDEFRNGWRFIHRGPESFIDSSNYVDHTFPEKKTRSSIPSFKQPSGAHDAYKRGDLVSSNGVTYRSIIDANVWAPTVGKSYWEIVSGTRGTTEWKKPTGVHDCYHKGYKVTFNGKTYESLMSSNVWSPEELPSSWKEVK